MSGELESRGRQTAELAHRVETLSVRVDTVKRRTALLRNNLVTLGRCLEEFINADMRAVMRRLVDEIHANRRRLHGNRRQ